MTARHAILVIDDDTIILESLCEFLRIEGYSAEGVRNLAQARQKLQEQTFSLIISDVNLPDGDGFEVLALTRQSFPGTVVILITGYGTIESAVEAIKMGAYDYLTKPIVDDDLRLAVERAVRQQCLMDENRQLREQLTNRYRLENIISQDYKMSRIFELIEAVADSKTTVLMTGPSGVGKSLLARALHFRSPRKDKPFIEVSCGALPETLLESELFGHVKGAFTGAIRDKEGKFLAADGGTIFLDEISSATPAMQVKLLRVLQDRQFESVGSNRTINVDVRVILASNTDLAAEVKAGRFREDLYYRINVVTVHVPPLAERPVDISLLADYFLRHFCQAHNRSKLGITEKAIECMQRYGWPGNVRELENVMERAVLLSKGAYIEEQDLPPAVVSQSKRLGSSDYSGVSLKKALEGPERTIIHAALEANQWNRQVTADALKINRTTLYKKMKRYGLEDEAARLGF